MLNEMTEFFRTRGRVTLFLAAANIIVFIVMSILGSTENASFMLAHGACYTPYILEGEYYRLFTGMFLHFGPIHLLYNMICLLAMGDMLEKEAGWLRYLLIYMLGGLAGNLLSVGTDLYFHRSMAVSAGASGAIFAVIGALLWLVLRINAIFRSGRSGRRSGPGGAFRSGRASGFPGYGRSSRNSSLNSISPERMVLFVALMVLQGFTESGTDNAAHAGGLIAGFVMSMILCSH